MVYQYTALLKINIYQSLLIKVNDKNAEVIHKLQGVYNRLDGYAKLIASCYMEIMSDK